MSLTSFFYEPLYSIADFDRLFDEAFSARAGSDDKGQVQRREGSSVTRALKPRMDLHEDSQKNIVTATFELPGLKKEDVNIDVHNNVLTVSGESKASEERDENGYAVRERRYGRFSRSIPLPQGIKPEDIKASMDNGVLTVTFPKTTPEQAPKRVPVS
ncbi:HSP20-like chaperone [Obba rivulosa]|uniref:HSP20-like chaperone n=1 Tax=Obba rivulosa TaxID=1052685 RepID=A0A8E2DLP3_9APHY|nr:HSP20-like chaperone [Obba rivulosa]